MNPFACLKHMLFAKGPWQESCLYHTHTPIKPYYYLYVCTSLHFQHEHVWGFGRRPGTVMWHHASQQPLLCMLDRPGHMCQYARQAGRPSCGFKSKPNVLSLGTHSNSSVSTMPALAIIMISECKNTFALPLCDVCQPLQLMKCTSTQHLHCANCPPCGSSCNQKELKMAEHPTFVLCHCAIRAIPCH